MSQLNQYLMPLENISHVLHHLFHFDTRQGRKQRILYEKVSAE